MILFSYFVIVRFDSKTWYYLILKQTKREQTKNLLQEWIALNPMSRFVEC